jgi:hypothetical protein
MPFARQKRSSLFGEKTIAEEKELYVTDNRKEWIGRMILDLMDPIKYNHGSIKYSFLSNMFRIVRLSTVLQSKTTLSVYLNRLKVLASEKRSSLLNPD